jgi:hypothetical protein
LGRFQEKREEPHAKIAKGAKNAKKKNSLGVRLFS